MADEGKRRDIPGSEPVDPGHGFTTPATGETVVIIEVTVTLRPNPDVVPIDVILERQQALPVRERTYLTAADMALRGPLVSDIAAVKAFAEEHGLEFLRVEPAQTSVVLRGELGVIAAAFGAELQRTRTGLAPTGILSVPEALGDVVVGVIGLDTRPVAATNPPVTPRDSGTRHLG